MLKANAVFLAMDQAAGPMWLVCAMPELAGYHDMDTCQLDDMHNAKQGGISPTKRQVAKPAIL